MNKKSYDIAKQQYLVIDKTYGIYCPVSVYSRDPAEIIMRMADIERYLPGTPVSLMINHLCWLRARAARSIASETECQAYRAFHRQISEVMLFKLADNTEIHSNKHDRMRTITLADFCAITKLANVLHDAGRLANMQMPEELRKACVPSKTWFYGWSMRVASNSAVSKENMYLTKHEPEADNPDRPSEDKRIQQELCMVLSISKPDAVLDTMAEQHKQEQSQSVTKVDTSDAPEPAIPEFAAETLPAPEEAKAVEAQLVVDASAADTFTDTPKNRHAIQCTAVMTYSMCFDAEPEELEACIRLLNIRKHHGIDEVRVVNHNFIEVTLCDTVIDVYPATGGLMINRVDRMSAVVDSIYEGIIKLLEQSQAVDNGIAETLYQR